MVPFLPFECLCCDLHTVADCHEMSPAADLTMQLNRSPGAESEQGECFCGRGLLHALARLTTHPVCMPAAGGVVRVSDRRAGMDPLVTHLPPAPAIPPEEPPPVSRAS
jgi:hypothetical protein